MEWGFFNEHDRSIKQIGYAVSLTLEDIEKAQYEGINLMLGSHTNTELMGIQNLVVNLLASYTDIKITKIDESNY